MEDGLKTNEYRVSGLTVDDSRIDNIKNDYADSKGVVIDNVAAEEVISGGMWVIGSAASGTTVSPVLKAVKFGEGTPLGVCLADVASGANARILSRGFYKGLIAEASINVGDVIRPGAGAANNCTVSIGSDAAQFDASDGRGICIMAGGSEATVGVYLW